MYKLLELDIDGVYRYMLLLKKKKYAAVTTEMRGGQRIETTELKVMNSATIIILCSTCSCVYEVLLNIFSWSCKKKYSSLILCST